MVHGKVYLPAKWFGLVPEKLCTTPVNWLAAAQGIQNLPQAIFVTTYILYFLKIKILNNAMQFFRLDDNKCCSEFQVNFVAENIMNASLDI